MSKKEVSSKTMPWSVICLQRSFRSRDTKKRLLKNTNETVSSCSWQSTINGGQILVRNPETILLVFLSYVFTVEDSILSCYIKWVLELVLSMTKLKRNWKQRSIEAVKLRMCGENESIRVASFFCDTNSICKTWV